MKTGFYTIDISPELPVELAGYAIDRIAYEKLDPLYASMIVFQKQNEFIVFCSLDVIAIPYDFVEEFENRLSPYRVKKHSIHLFASHTHSGPGGLQEIEGGILAGKEAIFKQRNERYCLFILDQMEKAFHCALDSIRDTNIRICKGTLKNIATNRNDPNLPGDDDLLLIECIQNEKRCLLYHFACHPTILTQHHHLLSADFNGAIREELSDEYDTILFINGACGDISTRFTRMSNQIEEVKRIAQHIYQQIQNTLDTPIYQGPLHDICIDHMEISLKTKEPLPLKQANELLKQRKTEYEKALTQQKDSTFIRSAYSFFEGAEAEVSYALHYDNIKDCILHIYKIELQNEVFITIPGEIFSQLTNPIKKAHGCYIFGYANGYVLYIADEEAYRKQVYEAASSPFASGQGEYLIQEITEFIQKGKTHK